MMVSRASLGVLGVWVCLMMCQGSAQMEMERFNRKARPFHEDVNYIKCSVCKRAVEEMWNMTRGLKREWAISSVFVCALFE